MNIQLAESRPGLCPTHCDLHQLQDVKLFFARLGAASLARGLGGDRNGAIRGSWAVLVVRVNQTDTKHQQHDKVKEREETKGRTEGPYHRGSKPFATAPERLRERISCGAPKY